MFARMKYFFFQARYGWVLTLGVIFTAALAGQDKVPMAVFAALLALLSSVLGLLGLRRWHGLSSRYEAPVDGEAPKRSEESDWDLMSRGVDPTDRT